MRRVIAAVATVITLGIAPIVASAPALAYSWENGQYTPLETSARLLDTRGSNLGRPLGAGEVFNLKAVGRGGIASRGVSAVVLNVTVTRPSRSGNLTVWTTGQSVPNTSSLNFVAGDTRSNLVTVPVSSTGYVSIRNAVGSTHVIVDVQGYYQSGAVSPTILSSDFFPLVPKRVIDTRTTYALGPGETFTRALFFGDSHIIDALALNVTVVRPEANGYVTVWTGNYDEEPSTSALNFIAGQTTTNSAIVKAGYNFDSGYSQEQFSVTNRSAGAAHVVVDIIGYYDALDDGYVFRSVGAPKRIVDTRVNRGTSKLGTKSTHTVTAPATVANGRTGALVTNVTAVRPSAATYLTVWAAGRSRPTASNLNPAPGQTVANMASMGLSGAKQFSIYNNAGSTDVLVDVSGRFDLSEFATSVTSVVPSIGPSYRS